MLKKLLAVLKRLGIRPAVAQDYLSAFPTHAGPQPKITPKFEAAQLAITKAMAVRFRRAFGWAPPPNLGTGSVLVVAGKGIILTDRKGKHINRHGKLLTHPVRKITNSDVRSFVENNEGTVPHLYGDRRGNVTVGIGHLVPSLGAAQAIAFVNKHTGLPGTPDEIAKDFEFARTLGSDLASDYEDPTILRLAPGEVGRMFDDDFIVHAALAESFFSLDFLPHPVQIALFDLAFQVGGPRTRPTGQKTGLQVAAYKNLHPALGRRDWNRAGREMDVNRPPTTARNNARFAKSVEALTFDFFFTTDPAKSEPLLDHLLKL